MTVIRSSHTDPAVREHMRKNSVLLRVVMTTVFALMLVFYTVSAGEQVPDSGSTILQIITSILPLGSSPTATVPCTSTPPSDSTATCGHDPVGNPPPPNS